MTTKIPNVHSPPCRGKLRALDEDDDDIVQGAVRLGCSLGADVKSTASVRGCVRRFGLRPARAREHNNKNNEHALAHARTWGEKKRARNTRARTRNDDNIYFVFYRHESPVGVDVVVGPSAARFPWILFASERKTNDDYGNKKKNNNNKNEKQTPTRIWRARCGTTGNDNRSRVCAYAAGARVMAGRVCFGRDGWRCELAAGAGALRVNTL